MSFSLLNGVFTARALSPDSRGILALAITASSLAYLLSSIGSNAAIRTYQPSATWATFSAYFRLSRGLLVVNVLVALSLGALFNLVGVVDAWGTIFVVAMLAALTFVSNQLLDVFNTLGLTSLSARVNSIGHLLTCSALGLLLLSGQGSATLAISAYAFGSFGRVLILARLVSRMDPSDRGEQHSGSATRLARTGLRFWAMSLGENLTFRIDQLILGIVSSPAGVGLYAVAVTPASLTRTASNSIGQVVFRQAATQLLTRRTLVFAAASTVGFTLAYSVALWLLAPFIVPLVFGAEYAASVSIVRILLIAELMLSPHLVLVRALAGANRPKFASAASISGLLVMAASVTMLAPIYGASGAAYSAVLASGCMLLVSSVGAYRLWR